MGSIDGASNPLEGLKFEHKGNEDILKIKGLGEIQIEILKKGKENLDLAAKLYRKFAGTNRTRPIQVGDHYIVIKMTDITKKILSMGKDGLEKHFFENINLAKRMRWEELSGLSSMTWESFELLKKVANEKSDEEFASLLKFIKFLTDQTNPRKVEEYLQDHINSFFSGRETT